MLKNNRSLHIFLAIVIGLAAIGYIVGTRDHAYDQLALAGYTQPQPAPDASDDEQNDQAIRTAPSYREIMNKPLGAYNSSRNDLQRLSAPGSDLFAEVERTPELYEAALADRAQNRAYAGAPPTIPHAIRETGAAECIACHGTGMTIDGKLATPISHEYMTNCTQCHVVSGGSMPIPELYAEDFPLDNAFVGLERFSLPSPAYDGAPPPIPHPTRMRTECTSCHGLTARPGLRTTHPWRSQCVQCHAPSATLDLRPDSDLNPFWQ